MFALKFYSICTFAWQLKIYIVHNFDRWKKVGETVLFVVTAVRTSMNSHKSPLHDNVTPQSQPG
jgi:hypothetical protein